VLILVQHLLINQIQLKLVYHVIMLMLIVKKLMVVHAVYVILHFYYKMDNVKINVLMVIIKIKIVNAKNVTLVVNYVLVQQQLVKNAIKNIF